MASWPAASIAKLLPPFLVGVSFRDDTNTVNTTLTAITTMFTGMWNILEHLGTGQACSFVTS